MLKIYENQTPQFFALEDLSSVQTSVLENLSRIFSVWDLCSVWECLHLQDPKRH